MNHIAKAIVQIGSDVLQFNEVNGCFELQTLVKKTEVLGDFTNKLHLVRGTDTATIQTVALLTQVDLKRSCRTAAISLVRFHVKPPEVATAG
ncbi:hypothetical protein Gpo141_00002564 [Globisporangium polare]